MQCEHIVALVVMMKIKTYSELIQFDNFTDRFNYLKLGGLVGANTFGFDRYLNQIFYNSIDWKRVRDYVILRDNGCDLGVDGFEIPKYIIIHHINPISLNNLKNKSKIILDPEFLITTRLRTHNAIHYGNDDILTHIPIERKQNDTIPWR